MLNLEYLKLVTAMKMKTPLNRWTAVSIPVLILVLAGCVREVPPEAVPSVNEGVDSGESDQTETQPESSAASTEQAPLQTSVEYDFVKPTLTDEEIREGWISLFDGVTLFGWDVPEGTNWSVEDGSIVADQGERSLLLTPFHFDDFEFRCDFHLEEGGNSGVFLRTAEGASNPAKDTYELNICDTHESHKTGSLVGRFVAEGVPEVEGGWHTFRVSCLKSRIQVWLDDQQIVDFADDSDAQRLTGRIGLQMNQGRIAFRNIYVKPLESQPLFNGEDLSGLRVVPGSKSQFEVVDGAIHVTDGPGFLETEGTFGDFVLHVEAKTNGDSLNSGVFFRAMQGTEDAPSHGYEMQIQNGFKDGDRTQPEDSGTGAIFRRAAARYVVANDNEWLVATLVAQGNRFATWVNGYQVVYWQDDREPDENPRRGQRLDAGHISLQGHDPTTNLEFRELRIHELMNP